MGLYYVRLLSGEGSLLLLGSYGLVGLLRPLTVYPSEMVYWGVGTSFIAKCQKVYLASVLELAHCHRIPRYTIDSTPDRELF